MSTTNGDREVYLAFLRKTEERKNAPPYRMPTEPSPSWLSPIHTRGDIWKVPAVVGSIVIAALCAYGIWQHEQVKPWAVQVAEECEASGKVPHVERGAHGEALAVRCDVR